MSLSVDNINKELLAGTSIGKIYRIFPTDLSATLHTEGHTSSINDISLLKGNNEIFATITKKGKQYMATSFAGANADAGRDYEVMGYGGANDYYKRDSRCGEECGWDMLLHR